MSAPYKVGYGRPPKSTRFKPGLSGNPAGRPNGTRNLKTDLKDELKEKVLVREGQTSKSVSKQRALIKGLMARAISGDGRAGTLVLNLMLRLIEPDEGNELEGSLSPDERAVLEDLEHRLLARHRNADAKARSKPRHSKRMKLRKRPVARNERDQGP